MRYAWTPEQAAIAEATRTILERALAGPARHRIAETPQALPADLWGRLAEAGLLGILVPEDLGGGGGRLLEVAAFAEAAGAALLPGPWLETAVTIPTAVAAATRDGAVSGTTARWLTACASGAARATFAAGDPDDGGRVGFGGLIATATADGVRLVGRRVLVPYVDSADCVVVTAVLDGEPALLLAPLDDSVSRTTSPSIDPLHRLGRLDFDTVVDRSCVLAIGPVARKATEEAVLATTAVRCVEMLGGARSVLASTVRYVVGRTQFDQPIGAFQAVKHRLASAATQCENIAAAAYAAVWAVQEAIEPVEAVHVAKAYASPAYVDVCRACLQMHGGIGFTWEADVHLYLKHARRAASTLGTATDHLAAIADQLLGPEPSSRPGVSLVPRS